MVHLEFIHVNNEINYKLDFGDCKITLRCLPCKTSITLFIESIMNNSRAKIIEKIDEKSYYQITCEKSVVVITIAHELNLQIIKIKRNIPNVDIAKLIGVFQKLLAYASLDSHPYNFHMKINLRNTASHVLEINNTKLKTNILPDKVQIQEFLNHFQENGESNVYVNFSASRNENDENPNYYNVSRMSDMIHINFSLYTSGHHIHIETSSKSNGETIFFKNTTDDIKSCNTDSESLHHSYNHLNTMHNNFVSKIRDDHNMHSSIRDDHNMHSSIPSVWNFHSNHYMGDTYPADNTYHMDDTYPADNRYSAQDTFYDYDESDYNESDYNESDYNESDYNESNYAPDLVERAVNVDLFDSRNYVHDDDFNIEDYDFTDDV